VSLVEVRNLGYRYTDGSPALDSVTFTLQPGERVGLVGTNGAGKTTLFLCLAGVLPVSLGTIHVHGLDPARPEDRRRLPGQVGIVFQNSDDQLFSATLFDDVAFGPLNLGLAPDEVRQRVAESLQQTGLTGQDQRPPFHLSGGAKRRAALAGVLAMRPSVLLLDEPSMFLDPQGRRDLIRLLGELPGTLIIGSHDLDLIADSCQRVLLMHEGKLVADGPTNDLLTDAALMERYGLEVPRSRR